MSDNTNYLNILEKISDIQLKVGKFEAGISDVKGDIKEIKEEDRKQNELLAEHIQGVKTNSERLNLERDARIEQHQQTLNLIEQHKKDNVSQFQEIKKEIKPALFLPKLAEMTRKVVLWIGAPAAAIFTLGRILNWF